MSLLRKTLLSLSENRHLYHFITNYRIPRHMARRFIAGETLEEALEAVQKLNAKKMMATLDHLGENVATFEEAKHAAEIYFLILDKIQEANIQSNVSLKLTDLGLDLDEKICRENLEKITQKAASYNNFIRIDMESSLYTERSLQIFKSLFERYKNLGVVIQAYLYRSEKDIEELIPLKARVRLCKGAYKEPPEIAFPRKKDVDANYIKLMKKLLLYGNYPAIATHDPRIIEETKHFAKENKIPPANFEFQMLYGIRRDLQEQLVKEGYNVRIYVPFGKKWYPYFMRRLAERPANLMFFFSSFIRG
jgi:proline dehydrogenase